MSPPLSGRDHVGQERREVKGPDPKGCCRKHRFREGLTPVAMWPHGHPTPGRRGLRRVALSGRPLSVRVH
ncbi:unnamed protein product [Ixodes hexagonus]